MNKLDFRHTLRACRLGYVTQAVVNTFAPLLFLTFQRTFGVSYARIALLISVNFGVQLLMDLLSPRLLRLLGYRAATVGAHVLCALGMVGLAFLPGLFPAPYAGLLVSVVLYAMGGGLIEVVISPLVEACPTERKAASMSLMHAFYCWGCVFVILGSTLFFALFSTACWRVLACLWAIIPLANALYFSQVPIFTLEDEGESLPLQTLLRSRLFWLMMLMMACGGASELAMSQWASAFAEAGLGVSKTMGDLLGPCAFALLMGVGRTLYAKYSRRTSLERAMFLCAGVCAAAYALAGLCKSPLPGLAGCALCGLFCGIFWPGTLSLAAKTMRRGGTAMFALFAFAGDVGCSLGPAVVGLVSGARGDDLHAGLLAAAAFPLVIFLTLLFARGNSTER